MVVIDGRSQDFHGKGDLRTFVSAATVGDPGPIDVAVGDARTAYLTLQPSRNERAFVHMRAGDGMPGYIVVADRVEQGDGNEHDYTSYLHTEWDNDLKLLARYGDRVTARVVAPGGAGLDITVDSNGPAQAVVGSFTPDDDEDWRTLAKPGRRAHDRLEIGHRGRAYEAISVLVPTKAGVSAPTTSRVAASGGIATRVGSGAASDLVLLATGRTPVVAAGGFHAEGMSGIIRELGGRPVRYALIGGRRLSTYIGEAIAQIDGAAGSVVADCNHVAVTGQRITGFRAVACPGARVTLNGEAVKVRHDGKYVVWSAG